MFCYWIVNNIYNVIELINKGPAPQLSVVERLKHPGGRHFRMNVEDETGSLLRVRVRVLADSGECRQVHFWC